MGYTNYWCCAPKLPAGAFKAAVSDCQKALEHAGITLAGPIGIGSPVFRPDAVAFNGSERQGLETFAISRSEPPRNRRELYFCKTNHLPYDLCVQVALIVFAHHIGGAFQVSSDGGDADWDAARRICQEHLGYGQGSVLTQP